LCEAFAPRLIFTYSSLSHVLHAQLCIDIYIATYENTNEVSPNHPSPSPPAKATRVRQSNFGEVESLPTAVLNAKRLAAEVAVPVASTAFVPVAKHLEEEKGRSAVKHVLRVPDAYLGMVQLWLARHRETLASSPKS
jgi:hypothetical protein